MSVFAQQKFQTKILHLVKYNIRLLHWRQHFSISFHFQNPWYLSSVLWEPPTRRNPLLIIFYLAVAKILWQF